MFDVRIHPKNLEQVSSGLTGYAKYLDGRVLSDSARAVISSFRRAEREQFATHGHGHWPPLSAAYAAWKTKHYPGKPLMVQSGKMRQALTSQSGDTIAFMARSGKGWALHLGVDIEPDYPTMHDKGIPSRRGKIIRKPIDPTDQQMDNWASILQSKCIAQAKQGTLFQIATATRQARMDKRK